MLNEQERKRLLRVARSSLYHAVASNPPPDLATEDPALQEVRGAFVTLKISGELRGCIGHVMGVVPLIESVAENARSAALHDPRFMPVSRAELEHIEIEVSALTRMRTVGDPCEVEVGRHGLMITCRNCRGLLLPQVPVEWGWEREEFLAHTCLKAGLPPDAWKEAGAKLEVFEAEVFGEAELGRQYAP